MKIKFRGMSLRVRTMANDEYIKPWCLHRMKDRVSDKWLPTAATGDKVSDHPDREYVEVLSPAYVSIFNLGP